MWRERRQSSCRSRPIDAWRRWAECYLPHWRRKARRTRTRVSVGDGKELFDEEEPAQTPLDGVLHVESLGACVEGETLHDGVGNAERDAKDRADRVVLFDLESICHGSDGLDADVIAAAFFGGGDFGVAENVTVQFLVK
jgi:hypothetical protein